MTKLVNILSAHAQIMSILKALNDNCPWGFNGKNNRWLLWILNVRFVPNAEVPPFSLTLCLDATFTRYALSGNQTVKVLPSFTLLRIFRSPECAWMIACAIASPKLVPLLPVRDRCWPGKVINQAPPSFPRKCFCSSTMSKIGKITVWNFHQEKVSADVVLNYQERLDTPRWCGVVTSRCLQQGLKWYCGGY